MGFRKGKGTRDAIFQLTMSYQKAFDRVKHGKLAEVMKKTGIPELERRLIINLYWRQHAAVRWDGEVGREVVVESRVRQGCVISPILFNLYSEFMIKEALEMKKESNS